MLRRDRRPRLGVRDKKVLAALRAEGADLAAPRHVIYFLFVPDSAGSDQAAAAARDRGLEPHVYPPGEDDDPRWLVQCEHQSLVLDDATVAANTELFDDLAARLGGAYDGWEASV